MVWTLPAKNLISFTFFLILSFPANGFSESTNAKMRQGISQFQEGAFKESVESFSSAQTDLPDDARIAYNLGNARYKEGKFQEALQAYSQSALDEKNPDILKNSIYNSGNTLVKLEKLEEAESAYKKVLALDPGDMDAKYNLEYVRQQLKKQEEQEKDPQQNQDSGEDSPSEKDPGENQQQDNEGDPQDGEQPQDKADSEKTDSENENPESPGQPGETTAEISKEEAEQMLEGLTEDLKSISRMQAGKTKSEYQGNDW